MTIYKSEKCFGVAGKVWAAIRDGLVVEVIPMAACPMKQKKDLRYKKGFRFVRGDFSEYRKASREKLSSMGKVVSGIASCGELVIEG